LSTSNPGQNPTVEAVINGPVLDAFLEHDVNKTHYLYLQHQHHCIGCQEAIVIVEDTAHLMDEDALQVIRCLGNEIAPTTWMSHDGKILPMELAVFPASDLDRSDIPTLPDEFIEDLLAVLAIVEVDGYFGIDTLAEVS
jgi:hypothetical protein